jgi:hypothetical protein
MNLKRIFQMSEIYLAMPSAHHERIGTARCVWAIVLPMLVGMQGNCLSNAASRIAINFCIHVEGSWGKICI